MVIALPFITNLSRASPICSTVLCRGLRGFNTTFRGHPASRMCTLFNLCSITSLARSSHITLAHYQALWSARCLGSNSKTAVMREKEHSSIAGVWNVNLAVDGLPYGLSQSYTRVPTSAPRRDADISNISIFRLVNPRHRDLRMVNLVSQKTAILSILNYTNFGHLLLIHVARVSNQQRGVASIDRCWRLKRALFGK